MAEHIMGTRQDVTTPFHVTTVANTHAFPAYFWPNDPSEVDRLDFQHEILKYLFENRNYFAPLSNPKQILDIGTGTGQWCIEMGEEFPEAEVQGTDLSPIQPTSVPENVRFFVDDAADEDWVLPPDHFDFIHTRMLLGCFTDFRDIIQKAFYHLKPGGFMESQEIMPKPHCDDGTMPADWALTEWVKYSDDAAMEAGRPLRIGNKLKRWYEAYGFVAVEEKVLKLPMNSWPKDKRLKTLGSMSEENWVSGIQGFSMAPFSRILNWSKAEIEVSVSSVVCKALFNIPKQVYLVNVRKAIQDKNVHAYNKVYVVWGRKPYPGEVLSQVPEDTSTIT
jgi:SAM-dependent methyltransferase